MWGWIFTGRNEVLAKVIFLHVCVILFTGGGSTWPGTPPGRYTPLAGTPGRYTPLWQVHPPTGTPRQVHPPGRYTPWQVHPLAGTPPGRYTPPAGTPPGRYTPLAGTPPGRYTPLAGTPPWQVHPPGRYTPPPETADPGIRSTIGWYASYWNAFLFHVELSSIPNLSDCPFQRN